MGLSLLTDQMIFYSSSRTPEIQNQIACASKSYDPAYLFGSFSGHSRKSSETYSLIDISKSKHLQSIENQILLEIYPE